ncbi:nuclear transport factor 2 family protein [Mesorhizobium sp. BAC0120]|uniref:nuclear transport factor 2 family protein n=1 Tax=Mesorhizobium sp. BAC0120 TaxID=3090670 RepID=UPI00298CF291|nr:nuclear transport factor 2 family protein [Mesorhizobium sp. BAC0120]MDW6024929.1 nuclear transport factor 2 family protein [Mesorhizobium sp. BAC0120]
MSEHANLAAAYIAAWNETDATRRKAMIEKLFAAEVAYRDPVMQGDGHTGIDQLIAGVHERFPGFRFALKGEANGFGDNLRFSWTLGPDGIEAPIEGTDFVTVTGGRMARVTGFLDKVPAQ